MTSVVQLALPVPLRKVFDYSLPPQYAQLPAKYIGCRARVSFGPRVLIGLIVSVTDTPSVNNLKAIEEILDESPLLSEADLGLYRWAANYHHHPIGEAISAALPSRVRQGLPPIESSAEIAWKHTQEGLGLGESALSRAKKQQAIHQYLLKNQILTRHELAQNTFSMAALKSLTQKKLVEETSALPISDDNKNNNTLLREEPLKLNEEQFNAVSAVAFHQYACYLLEGVTGSGKTEVYMQLAARALNAGKQVLILIPEIGLSPQTVERFKARFAAPTVELHSAVSEKKRAQAWEHARTGKAKIIIGTRLAALTPIKNLGLIVVDEEHDGSYKQQDGFRYSARNICIYRANLQHIPIVLGSATPSVESIQNARTKKYSHLTLTAKAASVSPPVVELVDTRTSAIHAGLSGVAIDAIETTIEKGSQVLIFLNRRGFSPSIFCEQCGWQAKCGGCDLPMTYHHRTRRLHCHRCERHNGLPNHCPSCRNPNFKTQGVGTEQLQEALEKRFSSIPTIRIDRDTTTSKKAMEALLEPAHRGIPCILIGTQMLAKGHHIPGINCVVVVDADQGFMSPEFRAAEHTGQLLIQVAGRAGRSQSGSRVLIQTVQPDHPHMHVLTALDYSRFALGLLKDRYHANLPPFSFTATVRSESKRAENALGLLRQFSVEFRRIAQKELSLVGPAPAAIEKIGDRFRFQLQIFSQKRKWLHSSLREAIEIVEKTAEAKRTRWSVEID